MPIRSKLAGSNAGLDVEVCDELGNVLFTDSYPPIADETLDVTQYIDPITLNIIDNGVTVYTDTVAYNNNITINID